MNKHKFQVGDVIECPSWAAANPMRNGHMLITELLPFGNYNVRSLDPYFGGREWECNGEILSKEYILVPSSELRREFSRE